MVRTNATEVVENAMYSPMQAIPSPLSDLTTTWELQRLPKHYISLHIRWGEKYTEASLQPIKKYMDVIQHKLPFLKDIFVSTETDIAIAQLVNSFPDYRFHFLRQRRYEMLDLSGDNGNISSKKDAIDYSSEFLFSMANLFVATEATGFVGTLSSNWCVMINHLQRTRGDAGYDYLSVDKGSAFSTCF